MIDEDEFRIKYGLDIDDEAWDKIKEACKIFKGRITKVETIDEKNQREKEEKAKRRST